MSKFLFTSESVSEGHPDKVADQISDAILDAMLAQDPNSRVACETMVTTGQVVVAGEVNSKAVVDIQAIVREIIADIGYNELCKSVNDAYRKAIEENPDTGIREFPNSIGEDFLVVWEVLGFADWYAFYDKD